MVRQLLMAQGGYKRNRTTKNPEAKEKLEEAMQCLEEGSRDSIQKAGKDMKVSKPTAAWQSRSGPYIDRGYAVGIYRWR